jgi:hypothetical protein
MANATNWMTDSFSQLSGKTLQEIAFFGTHDTGMSECHGTAVNVGALTASTKTQTLNVHDQVVLAGVRYLDLRPSYYEANALSDNTPSGNYLAHWSSTGSLTWGGLMGQPLADVCTNLTDAMAQLGDYELVLAEISHGGYLKEGGAATSLSLADIANILTPLITALGPYLYKNANSVDPFTLTLDDIFGGSTGPKILLWSSSSEFNQGANPNPPLPYYTSADGFFYNQNVKYYNSYDDADSDDPQTVAIDLGISLKNNLLSNPFFLLAWHITGNPAVNLSNQAAILNPTFQDSIANWFSSGIISANALPSIVACDFASSDTSQILDVCVALNYGQYSGLKSPTILQERSVLTPSILELGEQLYLAWTGTDGALNVSCSTDGGATFGKPYTTQKAIGGYDAGGPSLASLNGNLYIAWTGTDKSLNVAQVVITGSTVTGFTRQVTLDQSSKQGPSLASFNGNLYIAWTGENDGNLYVAYAPNGGMDFVNPLNPTQKSNFSPSLTGNGTNLMIAWGGASSKDVHVAQVSPSDGAPANLDNLVVLPNPLAGVAVNVQCPSITSVNSVLYLAWADANTGQLTMFSSVDNGQTFTNPYVSWQNTQTGGNVSGIAGPSLCASGQNLYFAWPVDGDGTLFVAEFLLSTT